MQGSVLVLLDQGETHQSFQLSSRSTVADLRALLPPDSRHSACFHLRDTEILLCDTDVLQDFAEISSPVTKSPISESEEYLAESLSAEELIREFEHCPRRLFPPPPHTTVCVRAFEGFTIFVRSSDCVHQFVCGPQDTLGDLRDACARSLSLNPFQLMLNDTRGRLLPLVRDGDALQDIENVFILDAEANEGSIRVFLEFSEFYSSYIDIPASASLSDFHRAVIAHVPGLESIHFRLWYCGSEVNEKEKRTVGQRLLGKHPVFVELNSELESLLLPKGPKSVNQRLCKAPALDMSKTLCLWFEDKEESARKPLLGLFPQSKLEELLKKVTILTGKNAMHNLSMTLNVDGRCLGRYNSSATLQELNIVSGAVIQIELPVSLIIDMGEEEPDFFVNVSCQCATIFELRKAIEAESGIALQYLRPTVQDVLLPDDLTISDCGFNWGDRVRCSKPFRLRCWWESGVASFFACLETDLSELVKFLEERTGIPRSLLILTERTDRVIFPSKNNKTLNQAGLKKNSEIVVKRDQSSLPSDVTAFPSFIDSKVSSDDDDDDDDDVIIDSDF